MIDTATTKVSVIIPVYNAKQYLQRCLDSVFAQTHENLEILVVNDGSTDGSPRVLERNKAVDARLRVIDQENQGQGVGRNRAIDEATGDFILFVDADDYIEPLTVQLTLARALEDESDFVHFDWKLSSRVRHRPLASNYFNIRNIWRKRILLGPECDELMDTVSFFSVTSLYRRDFLIGQGLRFGEGYIYEDNPFYALAANKAEKVSLIHSPLYIVQPNPNSTTSSAVLSDRHAVGHIRAINETLRSLDSRSPATLTYLFKYHLQKFMEYYDTRVPKHVRTEYARAFVDAFSGASISLDPTIPVNRYVRLFVKNEVLTHRKYGAFQSVIDARRSVAVPVKRTLQRVVAPRKTSTQKASQGGRDDIQLQGAFLFLGFDSKYSGNSRFLFEQMKSDPRFEEQPLIFVTDDTRVDTRTRISPSDTLTLEKAFQEAAVVFAESWLPPGTPKHPDSIWIQLWHGTPLKRVLFDSHEPEIISARPEHKVVKYRDVQKWDFLIADSAAARTKFTSAFLFPEHRIMQSGYPRVKYLLDNRSNDALKHEILTRLGLDQRQAGKKLVLYAPTWRDYNYGKTPEEMDYGYALDVNRIADELGDDFIVLFHDHSYLGTDLGSLNTGVINTSAADIQELLLVSSAVISDYSSVIFDAFAIKVPVVLYTPDFDEFDASRGVYGDMWVDLKSLVAQSIEEVVSAVRDASELVLDEDVRRHYSYDASVELLDFLDRLDLQTLNRNW